MTTITVLSSTLRLSKPTTASIKSIKDVEGKGIVVFSSYPDFEFTLGGGLTTKASGLKKGQAVTLSMAEGEEQQFVITPIEEKEVVPASTRPTGNGAAHRVSMTNELV